MLQKQIGDLTIANENRVAQQENKMLKSLVNQMDGEGFIDY